MKKILKTMIENILYDVVKSLILFLAGSTVSFPLLYKWIRHFQFPSWAVIMISIGISLLVTLIIVELYQYFSKRYSRIKRIDSDYTILEKETSFTYEEKKCLYRAKIILKMNKNNVRAYYGEYYWSGSGLGRIYSDKPNFQVTYLTQRTRYIEYSVVLPRAYNKGEIVELDLIGEMHDGEGRFSPYFSSTVNTPTKKLRIILNIDQNKYPISSLEKECIVPGESNHANAQDALPSLSNNRFIWEISKPRVANKYSLNWTFQ